MVASPKTAKNLNAQERRFVEEYLIDLDTERAAIAAGYSASLAKSKVYQWVSDHNEKNPKPHVLAAIRAAMHRRSVRTEITADNVLRELGRIGFSDMRRFTAWGPNGIRLKDYSELTDDEAAAVAEVSQTVTEAGGSLKFKLHDKRAALVDLGKHLGMFTEKLDINTNVRFIIDGLEPEKK